MSNDAINDEILRIKRELAAAQGNDLGRIIADALSRQGNAVSLPARQVTSEQSVPSKFPIPGASVDIPIPAKEGLV